MVIIFQYLNRIWVVSIVFPLFYLLMEFVFWEVLCTFGIFSVLFFCAKFHLIIVFRAENACI